MQNIIFELINSILRSFESIFLALLLEITKHAPGFAASTLLLIAFSWPIGNIILKASFGKKNIILATAIGFLTNIIIMYWSIYLKIPALFFFVLLTFISLISIFINNKITAEKIEVSGKIKIIFIFLCIYYLIPPLTWDYAFANEYDLFATGIKNTNEFRLPLAETYYPPGVAIVGAIFSKVIPILPINKLMINIFSLLPIFIIVLFYFFGKTILLNEKLGLFFSGAYALSALSKNSIFGGSAWPSLLSLTYSLTFLIFFIYSLNHCKKIFNMHSLPILIAAIMMSGAVLSHFDTAFVLIYAYIALFITYLIKMASNQKSNKNKYHDNYYAIAKFFIVPCIAIVIISPFVYSTIKNREIVNAAWDQKSWCFQQKNESRVKSFSEIIFVTGRILSIFVISGALFLLYTAGNGKIKQTNFFPLFLIIWSTIMLIQNTWFFVRLSRLFLPYYPLNIIMWMDLAILFSFLAGYGFFSIDNLIKIKYLKKYFNYILIVLIIVTYVSFETNNFENIYPDQGGYLKRGIVSKGDYVSLGDLELMDYLKTNEKNLKGSILNSNELIVGNLLPANSERYTYTHFYVKSYLDPSKEEFFEEKKSKINKFFFNPLTAESIEFIKTNNISYIFLSNEQSTGLEKHSYQYNINLLESGIYQVKHRFNGAKLLNLADSDSNTILKHFEAEDFSDGAIKSYYPPASKGKSILLDNTTKITIPQNKLRSFINKTITIYVKHTSFVNKPELTINLRNSSIKVKTKTNQVMFTETNVTSKFIEGDVVIYSNDNLVFIPIEVDWIEITSN